MPQKDRNREERTKDEGNEMHHTYRLHMKDSVELADLLVGEEFLIHNSIVQSQETRTAGVDHFEELLAKDTQQYHVVLVDGNLSDQAVKLFLVHVGVFPIPATPERAFISRGRMGDDDRGVCERDGKKRDQGQERKRERERERGEGK